MVVCEKRLWDISLAVSVLVNGGILALLSQLMFPPPTMHDRNIVHVRFVTMAPQKLAPTRLQPLPTPPPPESVRKADALPLEPATPEAPSASAFAHSHPEAYPAAGPRLETSPPGGPAKVKQMGGGGGGSRGGSPGAAAPILADNRAAPTPTGRLPFWRRRAHVPPLRRGHTDPPVSPPLRPRFPHESPNPDIPTPPGRASPHVVLFPPLFSGLTWERLPPAGGVPVKDPPRERVRGQDPDWAAEPDPGAVPGPERGPAQGPESALE